MEGTDITPQSTDSAVNKKRATPTGSLPTSSSSVNGSNNKRQRLDSKKLTEKKSLTADFISLDFSEGEGGDQEEPEAITQISVDAAADENGDAEEGEVKEKTSKKKKRYRTKKKRKDKELDAQGVRVAEKPEQLNLTGRGDSSDEENGIRASSKNSHSDPKDAENESEEEEDKDSSTRRALLAKMTNGTQIPEEEVERNLKPVETAAVTTAKPETDNSNLSNSSSLAIEDPKDVKSVTENGTEISARQKIKEEKKEKRRREKDKQRKAARKERKAKTQLDLPKGGGFSNLEVSDVIGISSDENDDEGLEINLDMDIEDLEKQQEGQLGGKQAGLQVKNDSGDEEGEVDENSDEASKEEIEDDDGNDNDDDDDSSRGDGGDDSPLLNQTTAIKQRKYYTAFVLPPFEHEEARPYFLTVKNPNFEIDLAREKKTAIPHNIKESKRICNVCTKTGHSEDQCELMKV